MGFGRLVTETGELDKTGEDGNGEDGFDGHWFFTGEKLLYRIWVAKRRAQSKLSAPAQ